MAAIPVLYLPVLFEYAKHGAARLADVSNKHLVMPAETMASEQPPYGGGPLTLILYGVAFAWGELFAADGVLQGDAPGIVPLISAVTSMLLGAALGLAGFIEVQLGRLTMLRGPGRARSFMRGVASGGLTGLIMLPPGLRLAGAVSDGDGTSAAGHFGSVTTFIGAAIVFALLAGCRAAAATAWRSWSVKRHSKKQRYENASDNPNPHHGPQSDAPTEAGAMDVESSCRGSVTAQ